jgi:YegS/Rv2252/BmrU family lipid kinase
MKKILYIINPVSGVGKQKIVERLLEKYTDNNKITYDIKYTEYAKHAIEISKQNAKNYDAIIAVGGDGSINEIAQGLIGTETALGVIPTGSGNGFARHIKTPLKIEKAIKNINNFKTEIIDTGKLNDYYFVNVAGIGFDALISHKFAKLKKRGFSSYIKLTASEFRKYKGENINLKINNENHKINVFLLTIANGSQYGNNAFIAPKASMQDGFFDVALLNKFPLISSPGLAFRLFTKRFDKFKYVKTYKTEKLIIEKKGKILAQIDGEAIEINDFAELSILKNSLTIIV